MKTLNAIALTILIIGGLNWLLVGLFQYDLVAGLFGGQDSALSRIIYVLVGISALYLAANLSIRMLNGVHIYISIALSKFTNQVSEAKSS